MSTKLHKQEEAKLNQQRNSLRGYPIPPYPPPPGRPQQPRSAPPLGEPFNDLTLLRTALKDNLCDCEAKLAMGADPNSANKMGQTALHVAAIWESMSVGAKLIEVGANINARNDLSGATPLHMAAQRGRLEFAKMLLAHGADPMITDDRVHLFAEDPKLRELLGGPSDKLHVAVKNGTLQDVASLCASNPELVAAEDGKGDTPLLVALELKKMDMVEFFAATLQQSVS